MRQRRRNRRRSTSRCSGIAALEGWLEGGLVPSAGNAVREGQVGALPSRPRFQRDRRSCGEGTAKLEGVVDAVVERGRGAQRAAARRPLPGAFRRQRQALPWAAQQIRVPCRHGPCADRCCAGRAKSKLYDRGRRRDRRCHDRGRADRAWRHATRATPLHQAAVASRHEHRRRAPYRGLRSCGAGGQPSCSACACGATRAAMSRPC